MNRPASTGNPVAARTGGGSSFATLVAFCGLVALCGGCGGGGARAVSFGTWQEGVETYVNDTGKGDPAVLRDTTYRGRPAFAQIGNPLASDGTDAVGVLLGHKPVAGRPSFVYLVGLVDREKVEKIHLAVCQVIPSQGQKAQFKWLVGKDEKEPTQRYLDYRRRLFNERFPGRQDVPPAYTSFPGEGDVFDLAVTPTQVTATHAPSGAVWRLAVGGGK
jgi:hypothetical protein